MRGDGQERSIATRESRCFDERLVSRYFLIWLIIHPVNNEVNVTQVLDDERLDETFAALANATRRAILGRLAKGEASVNELAEPFALTLPAISKHIKVLERAGLVVRSQRAQYRPCTLDTRPLEEVASWADQYRPIWEARFDDMNAYVTKIQKQPKKGTRHD